MIGLTPCAVDGCDAQAITRGWCRKHYARFQRHGDPLGGTTYRGEAERFLQDVVLNYSGDDCLFWPFGRSGNRYASITRTGANGASVHRIVCQHVNGPPPTESHQARHLCGNGHLGCVASKHVVWGTPAENSQDRIDHGNSLRGEECPKSKLTKADVLKIRRLLGVEKQKEIAKRFGVTTSAVNAIVKRRNWGWLGEEEGVVLINNEIYRLLSAYAGSQRIGMDTACNELLRSCLDPQS